MPTVATGVPTRGGKNVHLGSFATAEEAALCVARSPAWVSASTATSPTAAASGSTPA